MIRDVSLTFSLARRGPGDLIQIGATAELVLDHGWSPGDIDFERGEFDAVGDGTGDRPLLVMEAKARVSGSDSLEKLLTHWILMAEDPNLDTNNNAGRKYRELQRPVRTPKKRLVSPRGERLPRATVDRARGDLVVRVGVQPRCGPGL